MKMPPIKLNAVVTPAGTLVLDHLPFPPGAAVEVLIKAQPTLVAHADRHSLHGVGPYRFDDPFAPAVAAEDWEALR